MTSGIRVTERDKALIRKLLQEGRSKAEAARIVCVSRGVVFSLFASSTTTTTQAPIAQGALQ